MPPMTMARRSRALRAATLLAAGSLVLSACGGGDGDDADDSAPINPTPTPSSAGPDGQQVTRPGSDLSFGDSATVAYTPKRGRDSMLRLTVRSATKGALRDFRGFDLDDAYKRKANYYYVDVSVRNAGPRRVSGGDVPLWGVSGENTLLPAVRLTSSFAKCQTEPMPQRFRPGDRHRTCLVYLSPDKGSLEGVSYRPSEEFDPIVWTGEVQRPKAAATKQPGGKKGR